MCLFLNYFFVNGNKLFIHKLTQKHLLHHGISKSPETLGWISNEEGRDDCPMQQLQLSGRLLGFDPFGWWRAVSPLPNTTLQILHFQRSSQALAVGLAQCTPSSKPEQSRQLIGSGDGREGDYCRRVRNISGGMEYPTVKRGVQGLILLTPSYPPPPCAATANRYIEFVQY